MRSNATLRAGIILFIISLVIFFLSSTQYQIKCLEKSQGQAKNCHITATTFHFVQLTRPIGVLTQASVTKSLWSGFTAWRTLYNIDLLTSKGHINLAYFPEASLAGFINIAKRIDDYIDNSTEKTLILKRITPFSTYILSLVFLVIAIFYCLIGKKTKISLDKKTKRLMFQRFFLFRIQTEHYRFDEIDRIFLSVHEKKGNVPLFYLTIQLKNKPDLETIRLQPKYCKKRQEALATLNQFLDLPETALPSLRYPESEYFDDTKSQLWGLFALIILVLLLKFAPKLIAMSHHTTGGAS
jgi:hypothetical protein